jgi:hypothetical protein
VADAEPFAPLGGARRRDRGRPHRLVDLSPPQVPDVGHRPQHDMQQVLVIHLIALLVRRPSTTMHRLAPGTLALAAAPEQVLLHMALARTSRPRRHRHLFIATLETTGNLIPQV